MIRAETKDGRVMLIEAGRVVPLGREATPPAMWIQLLNRGGSCYRTVDVSDWREALRVLRFERSENGWGVKFNLGKY